MLNVSFTEIGGFMFEERVNDGGINVLYFYTEFCIFVELFYFNMLIYIAQWFENKNRSVIVIFASMCVFDTTISRLVLCVVMISLMNQGRQSVNLKMEKPTTVITDQNKKQVYPFGNGYGV